MPTFNQRLSIFYLNVVKRLLDFVLALLLLILLMPMIMVLLIVVSVEMQGNPIFLQKRVGLNERVFHLLKLKTMKKKNDHQTITSIGKFLRITSIDELPQLINILRGDMSFVGPRPLLPEYLSYYSEEEKQRHLTKPGLSGLSQIEIGNTSDWDRRMEKDIEYVHNQSFSLDFKILLRTIGSIFNFKRKAEQDIGIIKFDEYARNR